MATLLHRLGRTCAAHPWRVILLWLVAAAATLGGSQAFGSTLQDSFGAPGLDSQRAVDLLERSGSTRGGVTARVVVTPRAGSRFADDPAARAALDDLQVAVRALPKVLGTSDASGAAAAVTAGDTGAGDGSLSPDGTVAVLSVQYGPLAGLRPADLEALKHTGDQARATGAVDVDMGGELFFSFEEADASLGELAGVLIAALVLLVAFGSLVAAGLPIAIALFGLALGVGSLELVNRVIDIPRWAPQMATMIALGVGIDYALFCVTRHREGLARGLSVTEAAGRANATAGQAVLFAGGTVLIAISGLAVAGIPFMSRSGFATSIVVAMMVAATLTLLPALLGLFGTRLDRLHIGRRTRSATVALDPSRPNRWERWARHVSSRPWPYALASVALLVGLALPLLDLRLGYPDDGTLATSRTERRAYDTVARGFGPGVNGPLVVAVDLRGADPSTIDSLRAALEADPGIAAVAPAELDGASGVAAIGVITTTAPQDDATADTIDRLRAEVLPSALDGTPARAHIAGQPAIFGDLAARVQSRLPAFIAAVLAMSFVLLMIVFRSVLVPLKAALANLLSIGASYGVLVMVFQWGWAKSWIGLDATVPIVSFVPMFSFAVLFGLSMDYEVFLLSRVREEYRATGDNHLAVSRGLAATARVITSAALIMIAVFGGFVLGNDAVVKMMGLGLATAIFLDATVVRMVLVPATMTLMGNANWWLPGWLDRLLPTIDLDDHAGEPVREHDHEATLRHPGVLAGSQRHP